MASCISCSGNKKITGITFQFMSYSFVLQLMNSVWCLCFEAFSVHINALILSEYFGPE